MLDQEFWDQRYIQNTATWDVGSVSRPLKDYIDQLENKDLKILIPGCGNAHEAHYLEEKGFKDITLIDISETLVNSLKEEFSSSSNVHIILGDFFKHEGQYDLILEQTFFCAIDPKLRSDYATQMSKLLKPGGKLVGVLFNKEFENPGPPFGGNVSEYLVYFKPYFTFKTFNQCYNSIEPRNGGEVFIILVKN